MPVANNGLSVCVSAVAAQWFRVDAEFLGAIGRGQSAATVSDAQWIWLVLTHRYHVEAQSVQLKGTRRLVSRRGLIQRTLD